MGTNGGARPGAGRKKGKRSAKSLEKDAILAAFRQRTMRIADQLLDSQLSLARGQTFLFKIEKEKVTGPKGGISYHTKKPVIVENQAEISAYLEGLLDEGDMYNENDPGATYYYLTTKEPSNPAIDSLLDRTFGKSTQGVEFKGDLTISKILDDLDKENGNNR